MKFNTDNSFLFVEGMQFRNGEYETIKENEVTILKKYADTISIVEEKSSKKAKKSE